MWRIELTSDAGDDVAALRMFDRKRILDAIETMLSHEPDRESRNRKRLRPNKLAEWELRIDEFRVFYDVVVADTAVRIVAVGQKDGSLLFIRGERFEL